MKDGLDLHLIVPEVIIEIITWWETKAKFRFNKREDLKIFFIDFIEEGGRRER